MDLGFRFGVSACRGALFLPDAFGLRGPGRTFPGKRASGLKTLAYCAGVPAAGVSEDQALYRLYVVTGSLAQAPLKSEARPSGLPTFKALLREGMSLVCRKF